MPIANKVVDLVPACEYVFSYIWQVSGWSVMCGKSVICPLCVESQWLVSYQCQTTEMIHDTLNWYYDRIFRGSFQLCTTFNFIPILRFSVVYYPKLSLISLYPTPLVSKMSSSQCYFFFNVCHFGLCHTFFYICRELTNKEICLLAPSK
jgi:hypothetical protein